MQDDDDEVMFLHSPPTKTVRREKAKAPKLIEDSDEEEDRPSASIVIEDSDEEKQGTTSSPVTSHIWLCYWNCVHVDVYRAHKYLCALQALVVPRMPKDMIEPIKPRLQKGWAVQATFAVSLLLNVLCVAAKHLQKSYEAAHQLARSLIAKHCPYWVCS